LKEAKTQSFYLVARVIVYRRRAASLFAVVPLCDRIPGMPCPDCLKLYAELEAVKVELKATCAKVVDEQLQRMLGQLDQASANFERGHQTLAALVDRHLHDSLARLARLEAAMRFPRGEPPSEPPSEPPARH
jgi:hypothetical protein